MALDRTKPEQYPPNIQAILKRMAPAAEVLGQEILEVDVQAGRVVVAYATDQRLANRFGAIHGGMTAAMMDDAMSLAAGVVAAWGEITPTLEMKVSYIAQAKPGTRLVSEARAIKRGGRIMFIEADLKEEGGALVATASATVMISQMKR